MGESRTYFYDEMPEYHPDKSKIEKVLQVFNRDWDEITEEFVDWVMENKKPNKNLIDNKDTMLNDDSLPF